MSRAVSVACVMVLSYAGLTCLHAEKRGTDRLTDEADAVIVGEVHSGRQVDHSAAFTLAVIRTIKGEPSPGAKLDVSWDSAWRANKELKGNYGIWFLRRSVGGKWAVQPVLQGRCPFELAYYPLQKSGSPAGVAVVSRPADSKDALVMELVAALQVYSDRSQLYHLASGLLEKSESAIAPELYRALRVNRDPELRFIGLAGLVRLAMFLPLGRSRTILRLYVICKCEHMFSRRWPQKGIRIPKPSSILAKLPRPPTRTFSLPVAGRLALSIHAKRYPTSRSCSTAAIRKCAKWPCADSVAS